MGRDEIYVSNGGATNDEETLLLEDLNASEVQLGRYNNNLYIQQIGSNVDHVKIVNHFSGGGNSANALDKIIFSDGLQWDSSAIEAQAVNLLENPDYA